MAGIKLAPGALKQHWKDLVRGVIRDLVEAAEDRNLTPVLMWDELPLALGDVAEAEPVQAMEILDLLRELRQSHPSLRMVFSGSVGMHHVLRRLRGSDYRNEPTNDLYAVVLPPLSIDDAAKLAYSLLYKSGVTEGQPETTARAIAEAVDGVPFYVHHVALAMQLARSNATPEDAFRHVDALLLDANDPLQLRHYRERLSLSYEGGERALALATLDTLSTELEPCAFGQLRDLVASRLELTDDELLRDVLSLLVKDQYLARDEAGAYSFALGIVKRWWRRDRGLGE